MCADSNIDTKKVLKHGGESAPPRNTLLTTEHPTQPQNAQLTAEYPTHRGTLYSLWNTLLTTEKPTHCGPAPHGTPYSLNGKRPLKTIARRGDVNTTHRQTDIVSYIVTYRLPRGENMERRSAQS